MNGNLRLSKWVKLWVFTLCFQYLNCAADSIFQACMLLNLRYLHKQYIFSFARYAQADLLSEFLCNLLWKRKTYASNIYNKLKPSLWTHIDCNRDLIINIGLWGWRKSNQSGMKHYHFTSFSLHFPPFSGNSLV